MIDRLGRHVDSPLWHAGVAATFVLVNLTGYAFLGGRAFVESWGGGLAAVIATGFLVWKSQGYWACMVVNAVNLVGWFEWVRDERRHVAPTPSAAAVA